MVKRGIFFQESGDWRFLTTRERFLCHLLHSAAVIEGLEY